MNAEWEVTVLGDRFLSCEGWKENFGTYILDRLVNAVTRYSGTPLFQHSEMRTPLYTVEPLYSKLLK